MIDWKKSGYIVKTKSGKLGRTIHGKGMVNGKIPVYLATHESTKVFPDGDSVTVPLAYSDKAILCDPKGLTQLGFID